MSISESALDYFRRARLAEENGDLDEAAMLDSLYRQSLPTMPPPAEQIPKMPPRWEPKAA